MRKTSFPKKIEKPHKKDDYKNMNIDHTTISDDESPSILDEPEKKKNNTILLKSKNPHKIAEPQKERHLSYKQRMFVDYYLANNGNATDAAEKAGYKGNKHQLQVIGNQNLSKIVIKAAIAEKTQEITRKNELKILTKLQRQEFWSNFMLNEELTPADRLRASELLGKSQADFTDNLNTGDLARQKELTEQEQAEARRLANIRLAEIA